MISPEFIVSLKGGKSFPVYGGVLDAAHRAGLRSLTVELLQVPAEANYWTAIVKARAVLVDETGEKVFEELGDASPANCPDRIATALIRMAATRAKGRALRDAVNVGTALLEEMGEDEPRFQPAPQPVTASRTALPTCCECERVITAGQATLSERAFGRALCPTCQRAAKAA